MLTKKQFDDLWGEFKKALPKDPVPPVIKIVLLLRNSSMLFYFIIFYVINHLIVKFIKPITYLNLGKLINLIFSIFLQSSQPF